MRGALPVDDFAGLAAKDTDLPDGWLAGADARKVDALAVGCKRLIGLFGLVVRQSNRFTTGYLTQPDVGLAAVVRHNTNDRPSGDSAGDASVPP